MADRYQHLYELASHELDGEVERLSRVESKSFGLLTSLTLLSGVYGAALGWIAKTFLRPESCLDWAVLGFSGIVLAGLAWSWWCVFRALTIDKRAFLSVNEELITFYENNTLTTVNYYLTKQLVLASKANREITERKVVRLARGYRSIIATWICVIILLLSISINLWNTPLPAKEQLNTCKTRGLHS